MIITGEVKEGLLCVWTDHAGYTNKKTSSSSSYDRL